MKTHETDATMREETQIKQGRLSACFQYHQKSLILQNYHFNISGAVVAIECSQIWWKVNIGSTNGLVPSGNKPLHEPMVTRIYVAILLHRAIAV